MSVTRCVSSHLMTELLKWRNPQGSEENFLLLPIQMIPNKWSHAGKVFATEIGLCLLIVISAIETAVYSVFVSASLLLYPITDRPFLFFAKQWQSSSFTLIWGLANAVYYNPFTVSVFTHESCARLWSNRANPTSLQLVRPEDQSYISNWPKQTQTILFSLLEDDS